MKLTKIKIERFKKVREAELELSDLNILVGVNGSGKSSIIQAIHLASCLMRQASEVRSNKTSAVSVNQLDYLPTESYWNLGHGADWGNKAGTPSSKVKFQYVDDEAGGEEIEAYTEFRSAKNAGISVKGQIPPRLFRFYRGSGTFFSAYIPGISGIPNQESKQSKRVVLKACSYGDANVYLRNALNLLDDDEINQIEEWLSGLIGATRISVDHDDQRDLIINARVTLNGRSHPLELLGMGYLQLIQIFCYVLLFKPQVLLIDEPDIHLHPDVQEKLSTVLAKVAVDRRLKVLLTTHSPFIVRGAPLAAKIFWLDDGVVQDSSRQSVELALGWGAFGKKVIIVSEDSKTEFLSKLVSQWPEIEKLTAIYPGQGFKNLLTKKQAQELREALGQKFKIVVHRDRDSLTDEEVENLAAAYEAEGISLWVTDLSDVEAYFCEPTFISNLIGCTENEAENYVSAILIGQQVDARNQFEAQRRSHNQELYPGGGSPTNEVVWQVFQNRPLRGTKGKFVFNQLKNRIPGSAFSEISVLSSQLDGRYANSLRQHLENVLAE